MARCYLSISATFLTDRYHGQEWPPSPARMIQALLAGVSTGAYRSLWLQVEAGLHWIERRAPPSILTRPTRPLQKYKLAVPNNDLDVIARDWAAGRRADPAKIRTMKQVAPLLLEAPGPHVRYLWALGENEDPEAVAVPLRALSHCLYCLGWGVDMAYADVAIESDLEGAGWEEWVPSNSSGKQLAVPVPGFIDDLRSTYRRFTSRTAGLGVDTDTRPTVYRFQRYVRAATQSSPWVAFDLLTPDGDAHLARPWHTTMEVAAWMRHAAANALADEDIGEDVNAFVLGHATAGDEPSNRMSFVPLPSVGHQNADGRIRRVIFTEPQTATGRSVELLTAKLSGAVLTAVDGRQACSLAAPASDNIVSFYTATARIWRSVTPVVLHGYNALRGTISIRKTEGLLIRAFEMAGYKPAMIEQLAFQPAPLWPGTGAARAIKVPEHLRNYPRYHVEVRFRSAVSGPVLAGIGRHYGIGVFAAPPSQSLTG